MRAMRILDPGWACGCPSRRNFNSPSTRARYDRCSMRYCIQCAFGTRGAEYMREILLYTLDFISTRTLQTPDCAQSADTSHYSLHRLWVCVWVRDAARLLRCKKVCFARLVARVVCEPAAPEAVWGGQRQVQTVRLLARCRLQARCRCGCAPGLQHRLGEIASRCTL